MSELEILQVIDGILYKSGGVPVSIKPKDQHYRDAYREMQQRDYGTERWVPDGVYTFDGRVMQSMARG